VRVCEFVCVCVSLCVCLCVGVFVYQMAHSSYDGCVLRQGLCVHACACQKGRELS